MAFIADFGDKSVVSVEVGMEVAAEGVGVLGAEVGLDAGKARFITAGRRVVALLESGLVDAWRGIRKSGGRE